MPVMKTSDAKNLQPIRIECPGGPRGTKIFVGGTEVHGVRRIALDLAYDSVPTLNVEMLAMGGIVVNGEAFAEMRSVWPGDVSHERVAKPGFSFIRALKGWLRSKLGLRLNDKQMTVVVNVDSADAERKISSLVSHLQKTAKQMESFRSAANSLGVDIQER